MYFCRCINFWKRRKYCLPVFSPFPTMFSKSIFPKDVNSRYCLALSNKKDFLLGIPPPPPPPKKKKKKVGDQLKVTPLMKEALSYFSSET